jgi:hypothetical protein
MIELFNKIYTSVNFCASLFVCCIEIFTIFPSIFIHKCPQIGYDFINNLDKIKIGNHGHSFQIKNVIIVNYFIVGTQTKKYG